MSIRDVLYEMPTFGVDLNSEPSGVLPSLSPLMQNCFYRNGVQSRLGMTKALSTPIQAAKAGTGVHRFYLSQGSVQTLASAGTVVSRENAGSWLNIATGLSDGAPVTFSTWGPKNSVYIANGVNIPFKWDGSIKTNITAAPPTTKQFLPFLDRLLTIDNTDPSFVSYSDPYDDTIWIPGGNRFKVAGPGDIFGMAYHGAISSSGSGYDAKILFAKGSSLWILSANDLTIGAVDASMDIISPTVGCEAWRTIQITPIGTIFLGTDRQVYLLTLDMRLIAIGRNIQSGRVGVSGINSIAGSQMSKCWAVYHDGFYKLFIVPGGSSAPTVQYWLDVDKFVEYKKGRYGPWFGPFLSQTLSAGVALNGPGDNNGLLALQGSATVGSYMYNLESGNSDDGVAIPVIYQTSHDKSQPVYNKGITDIESELISLISPYTVNVLDTTGPVGKALIINVVNDSRVYFGTSYYGEHYYSGVGVSTRSVINLDEFIECRLPSIRYSFSSTIDRFELYKVIVRQFLMSEVPFV